ncbi:MAG: DUF5400 family protein [Candidatus Thorarchaeota archaeon]
MQLLLLLLFALSVATMFSGFMLARRMGMYLMVQVLVLMIAMLSSLVTLLFGVFVSTSPGTMMDLLHILLILDFALYTLALLMEFGQIVPILMKTMQGGPIHSSHMTNLLMAVFLTLGLVLYYVPLSAI